MFIGFDLIKQWGNISIDLKRSNYLHDLSLYSVTFQTKVSLNITRGLAIDLRNNISAIHGQLNLAIEDASLEEVLLQQRELATQYRFSGSIGFSYYFGSVYNNIVNTRFGD